MTILLSDPWFEAQFTTKTIKEGHWCIDILDGADGLLLWCPCGFGKPEFPLDGPRPHAIIASFANPINAPIAPLDAGSQSRCDANGQRHASRWIVSGTDLSNLTLSPSIDVGCWHGYITNGVIT